MGQTGALRNDWSERLATLMGISMGNSIMYDTQSWAPFCPDCSLIYSCDFVSLTNKELSAQNGLLLED